MLGAPYLPVQQVQQQRLSQTYNEVLRVEADQVTRNFVTHTYEWAGHVKAFYGETVVTADRLVVHDAAEEQYGEAIGGVTVADPEGTITASDLRFSWKDHTGSARNVVVHVSTLTLVAESVDIKPGLWTLRNVGGTGCSLKTPLYYVKTRELTVRPGQGGTAVKPELSILGQKIVTLPTQNFSLGGGGSSIELPLPQYRSDRGFGLTWSNDVPLTHQTSLRTNYGTFQHALPLYSGYLLHSGVAGQNPKFPRSELSERYGFGYFESVQVRDPESEQSYLRDERLDFAVGSTYGADARAGTTDRIKVNKPIEGLVSGSHDIAGFGFFGLARAQQVRLRNGPTADRLLLETNIGTPPMKIGDNFSLVGRLDTAHYVGSHPYGWQRIQAQAIYKASPNLRFGAAYVVGGDQGTPEFPFDALERKREFNMRADLDLDQTQVRVLFKWDPTSHSLFDQEFYVSQVIGCIEPFVVYRKHPKKFFVGLKLPIYRVFDRLSKREPFRRSVISGPAPLPDERG